jgi:hypothetical protein
MAIATREQLFKPAPRRYAEITLPVSGLRVRIQSLLEGEKSLHEASVQFDEKGERRTALGRVEMSKPMMICSTLVDDSGKLLLGGDDDIDAVADMDGKDVAAIYDVAWEHCGFAPVDVENILKNSVKVPAA